MSNEKKNRRSASIGYVDRLRSKPDPTIICRWYRNFAPEMPYEKS